MYGIAGERRFTELELDWLPGYSGSSPVRIGNAAFQQLQIDVYGELMDTLRGRICEEVIAKGYGPERNSFMQYYGSTDVDASLY
jgi:GH15 family glucan-1,4-alpha-glucosidase